MGIMQGRLTEPKGRGIQFFPFDNWKGEFYLCKKNGLQEIEFIFDYENYEKNPLWTNEGIKQLEKVIKETGIVVNSVCFDYFMRRPFYKASANEVLEVKRENKRILLKVLNQMVQIGATLIEIPLVDASSLKSREEENEFREFLTEILTEAPAEIRFGLETDLSPQKFLDYIMTFEDERVGANYDSGNSSGIGYDVTEEIHTLAEHIFNVHIKDRVYHGTTVTLGTGSADFDALFLNLRKINYHGSFILQAARGEEGKEEENIAKQVMFVKGYLE